MAKIGLDDTILSYRNLLNGCGTNQNFSILVNIPSLIKSEWVGLQVLMVFRLEEIVLIVVIEQWKGRGTWYYGHNHGGAMSLKRWLLYQCVSNNVDSWSYSQWAAVDAGNSGRSGWGTTNGIDNARTGSGTYHNDYICAFVR